MIKIFYFNTLRLRNTNTETALVFLITLKVKALGTKQGTLQPLAVHWPSDWIIGITKCYYVSEVGQPKLVLVASFLRHTGNVYREGQFRALAKMWPLERMAEAQPGQ